MLLEEFDVVKYERTIREEGIENLVKVLKDTICSREITEQQLMKRYQLSEEEAEAKIGKYW